jgi:hypothetical protein
LAFVCQKKKKKIVGILKSSQTHIYNKENVLKKKKNKKNYQRKVMQQGKQEVAFANTKLTTVFTRMVCLIS